MLGVIFDFDGPIFNGRGASYKALTTTFDRFETSVGRPTVAADALPLYDPAALIALAYAEFPDAAEQLSAIRDFYSTVLQNFERRTKVDNGVRTLLRDLKGRGIKCAILSSRQTAELVDLLTYLGLHDVFDEVWGRDMASARKPDTAAVTALAKALEVAPADLVFVGDSDRDYDATKDTGVTYYHAAWTGEPTGRAYLGCRVLLRSVEDMTAVLCDTPRRSLASHQSMPTDLVEAIRACPSFLSHPGHQRIPRRRRRRAFHREGGKVFSGNGVWICLPAVGNAPGAAENAASPWRSRWRFHRHTRTLKRYPAVFQAASRSYR